MTLPHRNQYALVCELRKRCPACGETKSVHAFGRSRKGSSVRVNPRCRECASAVAKTWREQNRDRYNAFFRAWRRDPENAAKQHARVSDWQRRNPEKDALSKAKHKAKRRSLTAQGTITAAEWRSRLVEFDGRCGYCGRILVNQLGPGKRTLEHMRPVTRGGSHSIDNVIPACFACNRQKDDRTLVEYAAFSLGGHDLNVRRGVLSVSR